MHVEWNPWDIFFGSKKKKKRGFQEIGVKITVFDWEEETTFGSSYRDQVRETRDSTQFLIM